MIKEKSFLAVMVFSMIIATSAMTLLVFILLGIDSMVELLNRILTTVLKI